MAVHNVMAERRPDLLDRLYQPFPVDRRGEVPDGKAPFYEAPVFNEHAGYISVLYSRLHIGSAQRFPEARRLTAEDIEALDMLTELAGDPDLRLVQTTTNRVFYLDPKLYAAGSRDSSFRTFYFEPKITTNKVRDDAVHLLVGFEHEAKTAGRWKFTHWDLVDLSHFKVRLKAEFQGSNRDMYRPEAVVATSAK